MKKSIFNAVCKTRYLALLVVLIFTCGNVWGASPETFTTTSSGGFSNNTKTIAPITVTFAANGGTSPSWQSEHLRFYTNNTVTISCTNGYNITAITINGLSGRTSADLSNFSANDGKTEYTWSGTSTSVVSENTGTGQARITSIVVTYSASGGGTTYTVSYALNGGGGTTPTESAKAAGAEFTLHNGTTGITPPTGKIFSKWRDQDSNDFSGGATYTMPAKNVTLTAQWIDEPSCDYDAATSLNVGDEIIIVIPASSKQMKAINSGGEVVDYPNACPDEELIFTVEEGYGGSDLALKTSDDKYLSWSSSTTVQLENSVTSTNQNWTAETVGGVLLLKNLGDGGGARYLLYYNNTNMRLYRDAGQGSTVKPTIYVLNGCEPLGSINGSVTWNHCPIPSLI